MTVILTFVGIVVFAVSCFTVGFKAGFKRLIAFALTGIFIDVLFISATFLYSIGMVY